MYQIKKTYHDHPSRNRIDSKDLTIDQARSELIGNADSYRRNSGVVVSQSEDCLIVEEGSGDLRITYEIMEVDNG